MFHVHAWLSFLLKQVWLGSSQPCRPNWPVTRSIPLTKESTREPDSHGSNTAAGCIEFFRAGIALIFLREASSCAERTSPPSGRIDLHGFGAKQANYGQ